MAKFDVKLREWCERIDDEDAFVSGVVVKLIGIRFGWMAQSTQMGFVTVSEFRIFKQ
ncbi:hypothetical protein ACFOZ7_07760 [Natribaculum luteum]|uniref:Uncharacterized protein n=1 Tax=Natribaculum luteum TaxID=1586232 RepID=A0ABD5NXV9_9EURY